MAPSVSGREDAVRRTIAEMITPHADGVWTDNLGNLIALKKGTAKEKKKIMLCAHMDEIGFIATYIEDSGYIRIAPVGGIDFIAGAYSAVISERGIMGVLVPEAKVKPEEMKAEKFVIDIGAKDKKDAEKKIKIGDFFVIEPTLFRLGTKKVCGRPLDDRAGCAIVIEIAKKLADEKLRDDVYYVFSVQEEVGCRGAKPAAFSVAPDYALVFDVTGTGDTAGASPMAVKLGDGAAIKIKDNSVICSPEVISKLEELAEKNNIKFQREILTYGGTDTSSIQLTGSGAKVGALSIPARYIHSAVETIELGDAEACAELGAAFVREMKE